MKPIYEDFSHVISPITGKIRFSGVQDLKQDYIYLGGRNGLAIESPALIDVRLDIVELRALLKKLSDLKFILQSGNFIAPNAQALDQLTAGFLYNNADGVLSIQVPGGGTIALPYGQILVGDSSDIAQATQLLNKQLLMGNSSNRAEAKTILWLDNMANLSNTKIWRGNLLGRPVESDALTDVENNIGGILSTLSDLANLVNAISNTVDALSSAVAAIESTLGVIGGIVGLLALQAQVLALEIAVSALDSRLTTAEGEIDTLQDQVADIYSQLFSINTQLTSIISQIIDLNESIDLINDQLLALENEIADITTRIDNLSATFAGDVQGSGPLSGPINLELMLTLDEIKKAEDTVDLNDNKMIGLNCNEPGSFQDAINLGFLLALVNNKVQVAWS